MCATLLKVFAISKSLLVESSSCIEHAICTQGWISLFLPSLLAFLLLISLITLAKISINMLNVSGESGHPCLIIDFRENSEIFIV